ncbi:MAG TPA: winged helix-turn-helix domain-containing protein, partial [Propionibacteriaceae bacterium]
MPMGWVSAQHVQGLLGSTPLGSPTYQSLAQRLSLLIVDGRLNAGVRMPGERDFAAALHLSRSTVAAAYLKLKENGYLQPRPGSGSFVTLPARHLTSSSPPPAGSGAADAISLAYASGSAP